MNSGRVHPNFIQEFGRWASDVWLRVYATMSASWWMLLSAPLRPSSLAMVLVWIRLLLAAHARCRLHRAGSGPWSTALLAMSGLRLSSCLRLDLEKVAMRECVGQVNTIIIVLLLRFNSY